MAVAFIAVVSASAFASGGWTPFEVATLFAGLVIPVQAYVGKWIGEAPATTPQAPGATSPSPSGLDEVIDRDHEYTTNKANEDSQRENRRERLRTFHGTFSDAARVLLQTQGVVLGLMVALRNEQYGIALKAGVILVASGVVLSLILLSLGGLNKPTSRDHDARLAGQVRTAGRLALGLRINYIVFAYGLTCIAASMVLN